jgi:hypothetical protein
MSTTIRFSTTENGVQISLEQSDENGPLDSATLIACAVHYLLVSNNEDMAKLVYNVMSKVFLGAGETKH